jgi:hypothetical protein
MMGVALEMWTVYDRPTDYPDQVVARKWQIASAPAGERTTYQATGELVLGATLDEVREAIRTNSPHIDCCVPRFDGDDPNIVEVWI